MRTALNKAISTEKNKTKELTADCERIKKNEKLEAIAGIVATIRKSNPEKREQILKEIADSKAAQSVAIQAKETAETGADFDKACDDERRAHDREVFLKKQLDRIDSTPNMDEAEYYSTVGIVDEVVKEAADNFRRVAENTVSSIVAAKKKYLEVATRADEILTDLDNASEVLQKKYKYREKKYVNQASEFIKDPNEWRRHARRFISTGEVIELAEKDGDACSIYVRPAWDAAIRCEAAAAAEEAKKMKTENKKKREEQRRAENSRIAELKNESKIRYVENNGGLTGYEYSIN